ncbi:unnamed protein product, partial [Ixodes hexagonus]
LQRHLRQGRAHSTTQVQAAHGEEALHARAHGEGDVCRARHDLQGRAGSD